MKQYARDAIQRHGRANYVIEDKSFFDKMTDELYMRVQPVTYTPRELNEKLASETFSLSAKSYPRKRPAAPDRSPRPVIIERSVTFLPASHGQMEKIVNRVTKPTFAHKLRSSGEIEEKQSTCKSRLHLPSDARTRRSLQQLIQMYPKHQNTSNDRSTLVHEATKVRFRSARSYISKT